MIPVTSLETEWLLQYIEGKKKYLTKLTNKTASQYLQAEILHLEKDVLPCVEAGSQLINFECAKSFQKALDLAIRYDVDSFIVYVPLKDEFSKQPKIGIFNGKDDWAQSGGCYISVYEVETGDGDIVKPTLLPLNSLVS